MDGESSKKDPSQVSHDHRSKGYRLSVVHEVPLTVCPRLSPRSRSIWGLSSAWPEDDCGGTREWRNRKPSLNLPKNIFAWKCLGFVRHPLLSLGFADGIVGWLVQHVCLEEKCKKGAHKELEWLPTIILLFNLHASHPRFEYTWKGFNAWVHMERIQRTKPQFLGQAKHFNEIGLQNVRRPRIYCPFFSLVFDQRDK